jgi:hypothetical protein
MKKLFVIITILGSVYTTTIYAQSKTPSAVVSSFQSSFANASNETWSTVKGLYRVDFILENEKVAAFFNPEGELIASSRDVSLKQIPMSLKSELKKHFYDYQVSSLFEVDNEDGVIYYATVNNNKNLFQLESTSSGDWVANKKIAYK